MKQPNGLRFESREIAVILSLFIFVSLLMFTVGIVIGKGLAQAKYEGEYQSNSAAAETSSRSLSSQLHSGSSVSINSPVPKAVDLEPQTPERVSSASASTSNPNPDIEQPLRLEPKIQKSLAVHEEEDKWAMGSETESLIDNPVIRDLFEEKDGKVSQPKKRPSPHTDVAIERDFSKLQAERTPSSITMPPSGSSSGPYSVQIAAYSEESQAQERVESLKKMGYPHAYFSSVNLGENKETWFRVWLGHYPSFESAKLGGKALQARGEVKNFLVRKTQKTDSKN